MASSWRRVSPRIEMEALCWEVIDDRESSAMIVDLSTAGARIERPYTGGRLVREIPLQLELPEIDEVMWARGTIVFDHLVPAKHSGPFGLVRRTGFHIAMAAGRDLRLLRDYVYDLDQARRAANDDRDDGRMMFASCYSCG